MMIMIDKLKMKLRRTTIIESSFNFDGDNYVTFWL